MKISIYFTIISKLLFFQLKTKLLEKFTAKNPKKQNKVSHSRCFCFIRADVHTHWPGHHFLKTTRSDPMRPQFGYFHLII